MAKRRQRRFYTDDEKREYIRQMHASGLSIGAYCEQADLTETAFRRWLGIFPDAGKSAKPAKPAAHAAAPNGVANGHAPPAPAPAPVGATDEATGGVHVHLRALIARLDRERAALQTTLDILERGGPS